MAFKFHLRQKPLSQSALQNLLNLLQEAEENDVFIL